MQRGPAQATKKTTLRLACIFSPTWPSFGQPIGLIPFFPELQAEVTHKAFSGLILSSHVEFLITNYAFCVLQRETAQLKNRTFL
jgi:hypothetical protein